MHTYINEAAKIYRRKDSAILKLNSEKMCGLSGTEVGRVARITVKIVRRKRK